MADPRLNRRSLLAGAVALPLLPGTARAEETVVVATWGGDYNRLLRENVEEPILAKEGIKVVPDLGDEDPRVAKMIAQRRLPRGGADVVCVQAVRGNEVAELGLVETLTEAEIPNLKHVLPRLRLPGYVPHIWSPQVLISNPEKVPDPPKTFTDLLAPKWKGKVGVGDTNYMYVMMAAALAATGDVNQVDAEATKVMIIKLNDNGLRLYPTTDSIAAGIKSGEIDVGMMWLARTAMWQNAGIAVKGVVPSEGAVLYVSGMVVPKNAPNKAGAFKYLNAMLEPRAQLGFAEHMGYQPTVGNATLTGKVGEQLALPDKITLAVPDYSIINKQQTAVSEWWKRTMQRS